MHVESWLFVQNIYDFSQQTTARTSKWVSIEQKLSDYNTFICYIKK